MTDTLPAGRELDAVLLRRSDCGLERWNRFTEQWEAAPFPVWYMTSREIDAYYRPQRVEWAALKAMEAQP